jgi:hypothetical protein
MKTKKSLIVVFVGIFVAASITWVAQHAYPAPADHLKCYKIRDSTQIKGTIVNLDSAQFGFAAGCTIKKALELCVPVKKTVVDPAPGVDPGTGFIGPDAAGDYICYTAKCPNEPREDLVIKDQFRERLVKRTRTVRLCAPAVKFEDCHDPCVAGLALVPACSPCAATVCASDPFCCSTSWDSLCVDAANDQCNAGNFCT